MFKKIREDEKVAELQHKDGHTIRIAKQALSPKMRAKLAEIPLHMQEGGEVDQQPVDQGPPVQQAPRPSGLFAMENDPNQPMPNVDQIPAELNTETGATRRTGATRSFEMPTDQPQASAAPQNLELPAYKPEGGTGALPVEQYGHTLGAFKAQESAIDQQAKVAANEANAQALVQTAHELHSRQIFDHAQTERQRLDQEISNVIKDRENGHINPNQYLDNMSTGRKVFTALGMLISGMGAGMTGQPNQAEEFLKQQIERNIDAQKANLDKNDNVLSALYHQMGNLNDATNVYRAFELDNYALQMDRIAKQFGGPEAQAAAAARKAQIEQQSGALKDQVAYNQALMKSMNSGGGDNSAMKVSVFVPKEQQPAAYKELNDFNNSKIARDNALNAVDEITSNESLKNLPNVQYARRVDALWEPMKMKLIKETGGRINEKTLNIMDSLKPRITDTEETGRVKRQRLAEILQPEASELLKGYGINLDYSIPHPRNKNIVNQNFYKSR